MTHKTFRKVVSLVLASCLIASGIPANASNGEVVTLENENGSVVFTEVVAKEIGEMFSRDLESANESLGKVVETTPMYSATGENLTSYLVEFEKGYAVLNANIAGESQVLEWGYDIPDTLDTGNSGATLSMENETKLVYEGPFSTGILVENRVYLNSKGNLGGLYEMDTLLSDEQAKTSVVSPLGINQSGGYITDAGKYASNVYGGTWTCTDWYNAWENYATYIVGGNYVDEFTGACCGPIAITTALRMYGKKHNISSLKYSSEHDILNKVAYLKQSNGLPYFIRYGGTDPTLMGRYAKAAFSSYGQTINTYGRYVCSIQNLKTTTKANKLGIIKVNSGGNHPYGDHFVLVFAWSEMSRTSDGQKQFFVKISDGINGSGRYLCQPTISSYLFWELSFK